VLVLHLTYGCQFSAVRFRNEEKSTLCQPELLSGNSSFLDLDSIIYKVIQQSFPTLQGVLISSRLVDADNFLAGIQWQSNQPPSVLLSFSAVDLEQMPQEALVGCIVHELCHVEYDVALSGSDRVANDVRYAASAEYRSAHEREIDMAVIEKGYGPELLALQSYHDLHYEAYESSDGLTQQETRKLMHRILASGEGTGE
jgi:hypothetical protein